jgi:hypothetical protein
MNFATRTRGMASLSTPSSWGQRLSDEIRRRRSRFREGSKLRLADGQMWTLPAPADASRVCPAPFTVEYRGLLKAIVEAEDDSEQRLAELAFVVFLLGENYSLSPADYEALLTFAPETAESSAWQFAVQAIVQEHLGCFNNSASSSEKGVVPIAPVPGKSIRLLSWFSNHIRLPWPKSYFHAN